MEGSFLKIYYVSVYIDICTVREAVRYLELRNELLVCAVNHFPASVEGISTVFQSSICTALAMTAASVLTAFKAADMFYCHHTRNVEQHLTMVSRSSQ